MNSMCAIKNHDLDVFKTPIFKTIKKRVEKIYPPKKAPKKTSNVFFHFFSWKTGFRHHKQSARNSSSTAVVCRDKSNFDLF